MMIVLYIMAAMIGISLGLIGAGGAIVAVPTFVYVGGIDPNLADGYALFIVAVSSAVAVVMQGRAKTLHGVLYLHSDLAQSLRLLWCGTTSISLCHRMCRCSSLV